MLVPSKQLFRFKLNTQHTSTIAFLFPWIALIVVAAHFPKAGAVVLDEFDAGDPFGLFQKYQSGMTTRTGPPCSRAMGLPSQEWASSTPSSSNTSRFTLVV